MGAGHGFFTELKRRHVWRVAIAYVITAWLLLQLASIVLPGFAAPDWVLKAILVVFVIFFPLAILLAWAFEMTPDGVRRTEPTHSPVARETHAARAVGRKLNTLIIAMLVLAVALLLGNQFIWRVGSDSSAAAGAPGVPAKSIAVLPFENLSDAKGGEYFVVGIQDEILTRLANIGDLKVVSRTSTEMYRSHAENLREVGRELGVGNIVEGSVQRAGDKVRITVQLIDAHTDTHLWAHTYDREMRDVFAVQSDVAGRIASALKLELQPEETQALAQVPTIDPVAYDLFLRAEYLANRGGLNLEAEPLRQSLAPYRQAITRDPSFALALARLSYAQSLLVWLNAEGIDAGTFTAKARANAEQALVLNPNLADGYIALGFSDYYGRQDYDAALASFATAQRLRPNDAGAMAAAGYVYRRQGRNADAIRKLEEALDHDPRNARIMTNLAATYVIVWRYADAETALRRALAINPDNMQAQALLSTAILYRTGDPARALTVLHGDHPYLKSGRASLLWTQRRYAEAIAVVESIPDSPDYFEGAGGYSKAAWLGSLYRDLGDSAKAQHYYRLAEGKVRRDLAEAEAEDSAPVGVLVGARQTLAAVEFGLGRIDEALRLTEETQALLDGLDDEYIAILLSTGNAGLYSRAGRADLAVPLLDRILGSPNGGFAYSPALLPLDRDWDPIRDDPRFVALLAKYPASSVAARGARPR